MTAKQDIIKSFPDIIHDVASGDSLMKALDKHHTHIQVFFDYIDSDPKLYDEYTRAREQRGESCVARIDEYQEALKQRTMDAQTARVLIDTEKWKASKFYPKMYGEKQAVEVTGKDGKDLALTPPVINILPVKANNGDNG